MSDVILMTGVGSYLPKNKFSNEDLSQFIDTSDEWITKRSGIKSRHFVSKKFVQIFIKNGLKKNN